MYRISRNSRRWIVIFVVCSPIYLGPVFAQENIPTADQKAAIQDLFKVSAAVGLCGYQINVAKVSGDLATIGMTFGDAATNGRFWPYISSVYPSFWAELQKMRTNAPKDAMCSRWAVDYGETTPLSGRRAWLQKAD